MTIDAFSQYAIMILGPSAVWVVGWKGKYRRWGYIIGAACQPFWFITLYQNKQWPVFIVAFLYTFSWIQGIWNHWIKPWVEDRRIMKQYEIEKEIDRLHN